VSTDPTHDPRPIGVMVAGAAAVARAETAEAAIGAILGDASAVVGAQLGAVFVQDPEAGDLQLVGAVGFPDEALPGFAAEVADDPDHPITRAAATMTRSIGRVGQRPDGATMTGVDLPLVVTRDGIDQSLGVVSFGWHGEREIDANTATLLGGVADLLAAAVDRARLASLVHERAEWFERLSQTDPLTGLANARTLARVLELELARAGRQGGEVSVAIFDVDGFAGLNEREGRAAGDDALRRVAEVLGVSVRLVDTIARTGADEFVVVAPGSAGATVARRIADGVSAIEREGATSLSVTTGVATFPADGGSSAELLGAARAALDAARA
jgi:diguanylate cyclase (GGDEF)-like protein